ncbi:MULTISPECIES: TetR/AcrR family transcriptional regulator [Microbacterium]|uniref:TetR/AcrR family transcriptional regulator n=1 Tax=Microbacterium TaxID=33882 RepID=UPI001D17374D|nr:TetR/AcrR family transcriptional regulator [Microbacterium testaceum]MCC4248026.1 TetR/AcrR family transcriptional regulator [Microbacterium testaceum]
MTGRPRSFDRDAALAVAVELFWRQGFDRTSIAELTEATGVNPPSLYAAFGDKKSLFEEAAGVYFARTCEGFDAAAALPDTRTAMARVLDDTARAHTDTTTPPGCLLLTEPRLSLQRAALHDRLRRRLDQGVRDGDLPAATDTDALATYFLAVLRGMSGLARDGGTFDEVRAVGATALAVLPPSPHAGD